MASKKTTSGSKGNQPAKQQTHKPRPVQSQAKAQPKKQSPVIQGHVELVPPSGTEAAGPLFSGTNIAVFALSVFLIAAGATVFARIQFAKAEISYSNGLAPFVLGVLLPCVAVPNIRSFLVPSKTLDEYEIGKTEQKK